MAISYVGGKGEGRTNASAAVSVALDSGLTGGSDAGVSAGDLVVVTVSVGTAARQPAIDVTTPTGYTPLTVQRTTATTYDTNTQVSYKIMGSTPDTTVTIPGSANNADGLAYTIQVFRGVDPDTPMDTTPTYATGSGTNNRPDPAAITPVTTGAWIVVCGAGAAANGTTALTASYLTNFLFFNGADTNDGSVGSGYYTAWTSGAYDPAVFAGGSVSGLNSWGATTIALRPGVDAQTLLPPLTDGADAFFAATVTVGAVTLSPPLVDGADGFFAATVTQPGGGGITFLGAVDNGGTTGALDLTPLNLQEGDFLLAAATDDNATGAAIGSPWTALSSGRPSSVGHFDDYLICGPTPPTSVDFTGNVSGVVVAFRGVDTTTPLDVTAPTYASATTGMPDPPSITTVTDGAVIVIIGHLDDDGTIGATIAAPTDYTLAGWGNATALAGSDSVTMVAYRTLATAGTDDPGVFTSTGGTDDWVATTYALRPAPGGSGGQTLLPGLVTGADGFFAATVTPGAITIAPPLTDGADGFFAATVTSVATIAPPLVSGADGFFAATITVGPATLLPPLVDGADGFFAPTVTQAGGVQTLLPPLTDGADGFFAATVTAGAVTLLPGLVSGADGFFGPTVTVGAVTLLPSLVTEADGFFGATVTTGAVTLSPPLTSGADGFFAATITTGAVGLLPPITTGADGFFAPTVTTGAVTLLPPLVSGADEIFPPIVVNDGGPQTIIPPLVDGADGFFAATITVGPVTILPPLVSGADEIFPPTVGEGGQVVERIGGAWLPLIYVDRDGKPVDINAKVEAAIEAAPPEEVAQAVAIRSEIDLSNAADIIARGMQARALIMADMIDRIDAALAADIRLQIEAAEMEDTALALLLLA